MTETPQQRAERLVSQEVLLNVSALVSELAGASGSPSPISELCDQALELTFPVPDYEEATYQAGWVRGDAPNGEAYVCVHTRHGQEIDREIDDVSDTWKDLCEAHNIEPYEREVFEHWAVSRWLGEKLAAKGEKVDFDFAGMVVWARTTTGQGIALDSVIEEIVADLQKPISST